ncbi:hypothetical protein FRC96_19050 [Lujinxingia vulgaris]|uniref:Uncharacterized protein n=1 Tax=Lujinxingia vulgaris TaxID=2600176 RepID=A0A5C6WUK3_9DELT|nr:hypothetical protein [Lujinxingia vulgaris]TXD32094.1 hypothetical protein FRC96_19050 [Lujinxingia vulgaris]
MKLPFQKWLDEIDVPPEARLVFDEAFTCYKAGADRAALLFSVLGFNLTIRKRLLEASNPNGIPSHKWTQIRQCLQSEDQWDNQVFDSIKQKQPAPIFLIRDDIRRQVEYWRDRRNDCAHFKDNEISSAHVDMFWQFVRANLGYFVPSGSREALIEGFVEFFNPDITDPTESIAPLIENIPRAVPEGEYINFFQSLAEKMTGRSENIQVYSSKSYRTIVAAVFESHNEAIILPLLTLMRNNVEFLAGVLRENPNYVLILKDESQLIRQLWRSVLFDDRYGDLPVYAAMLRHGIIPSEQISESVEWVIKRINGTVPSDADWAILEQHDFWDEFQVYAFEEMNANVFPWANRNAELIVNYLRTHTITPEIAGALRESAGVTPLPYVLRDRTREFFERNPEKYIEFKQGCEVKGLTVPAVLELSIAETGE